MTIDYAMRVAIQLQNEGKSKQAQTILNSILDISPTQAHALHLSGIIAYQKGEINLGIELIQKAIHHNSTVPLFYSNLGEMYRQLNVIDLSVQCGERAIAMDPNSATALSNLGISYFDAKLYAQAENCHQRALSINPKLSFSLNNMGSIYKIYGKTQKAIAFYEAAIAAAPHFAEPLNNLGALFLQQQEFKQAHGFLAEAIQLAPTFADAHCNMGLVLLGLEQCDEALLYLEKAAQFKPNYAEAYYGIAKVHLHQHHYIESEYYIRKAIDVNPLQLEFYQLLAEIYCSQGKHSHALMHLDHALSIDATFGSLYISKGNVLMEMGEISGACEQFLKAVKDPAIDTQILAHYCLVQLQKIESNNPHLKELLFIANNINDVSPNKLEYIYFALGKCYDDMGEWKKSFTYFKQGCQLKRKRVPYNIAGDIKLFHKIIDTFTKESLENFRKFANPSSLPIFIVGMPRSGTTLVEQILASHSNIVGGGELTYLNDLIQSPNGDSHKTKLSFPENIMQLTPNGYRTLTEKYLLYLRSFSSDALYITDKMPHNFIAIGLIHALFPNAKIIHVKRNAIDTCLSCYTKLFSHGHYYSYDLTELGQYYNGYKQIMEHWRRILPADSWLEINYEDITENIEREAKKLISYCTLTWDPACLAFYEAKRQVRTASFLQVRQPIYTSSVNRWRHFENELTPLINILGAHSSAQQQI